MDKLDRYFEVKAHSDGTFEGYLAVFGEEDSYSDVVVRGAFKESLAKHKSNNRLPALLWQHDSREPIGIFTDMIEDNKGLFVKAELFIHDIPRAKQAHKLLSTGGMSGMSIGYKVIESDVNASGVRLLKEVDLMEGSLVTFPAQDNARIVSVKDAIGNIRDFENFLRDAGLSRKQAKALLADGYKAIQCDADDNKDEQKEMNNLYKIITGKD